MCCAHSVYYADSWQLILKSHFEFCIECLLDAGRKSYSVFLYTPKAAFSNAISLHPVSHECLFVEFEKTKFFAESLVLYFLENRQNSKTGKK
jgi:hypothetical protein